MTEADRNVEERGTTAMPGESAGDFNLLNPLTFAGGHPFEAYDRLRSTPLARHPGQPATFQEPFWVATGHSEIHAVSHDTQRFTSTEGFNINQSAISRMPPAIAKAIGANIITYDPPSHTAFKRLLMPGFSPQRLKQLEAQTLEAATGILDGFSPGDDVEIVTRFASIIPIRVLCLLIGIPLEDEPKLYDWTAKMVGGDPDVPPDPAAAFQAFMEVFAYGKWLVEQRRKDPKDDLMSLLAHGEVDGEPLSDATRDGMCATLVAAGNETTRNGITGALVLLAESPDQRAALAGDPTLAPNAVEECLRRTTPVIHMIRTAKEDLEVAGQAVKAGERIALLYGAANHDPSQFVDPYAFDIRRDNARKHLAFGTGIHLCIGARLAQMEMRIALTELLNRFPDFELTSDPVFLHNNFVSGIKRLNLRLQ